MAVESSIVANRTTFPILQLPTELCCYIISEIDSPADLLRLALTARCLCDIIIPDHLEYRRIMNHILGRPLWTHLANHRGLAENVRELTIRLSTHYKVPGGLVVHRLPRSTAELEYAFLEARPELCKAMRRMTGLKSFRWALSERSPDGHDMVWETLLNSCPNLSELQVEDYGRRIPGREIPLFHEWKLFDLRNLTTVKVYSMAYRTLPSTPPALLTRLQSFLLSSPALRSLDLMFIYADPENARTPLDSILALAHWPALTHLSLAYVSCAASTVASFLSRHPSLESLSIKHDGEGRFDLSLLPARVLSNLKSFEGAYTPILHLSRVAPEPPVEVVKFECRYEEEYAGLARALRAFERTLRRVEVPSMGLGTGEGAGWQRVCEALPEVTVRDHRTSWCLRKMAERSGSWVVTVA